MRLLYSSEARADLRAIRDHGLEASLPDPIRHVRQLRARFETLRTHPEAGRKGRVAGTRELVLAPYVVVYTIDEADVRVRRVLHGAQQWPNVDPQDNA